MAGAAIESPAAALPSSTSPNPPHPITSAKSPSKKQKPTINASSTAAPVSSTLDLSSPRSPSTPKLFRRYSRGTLLHLQNSPLVAPPSGMPQSGTLPLKDAFTDDAPHTNTSRKDHHNDSSTNSGATGRARPKRDNDDETRPLFRNQFSQSSKMGSFALQRSDDQNSLRNLAETFDRKKQLLATTSASARDTLSTRNGNGLGRRDDRDITKDKERSELAPWERKDNFKSDRSNDWRRPGPSTQDGDDNGERRPLGRQDRNTDRDDDPRKDRSLRGRGRSPSQERSRWVDRRRSQSRRRDREEGDRPLLGRRAKDADTDGDRRVSGTRRLGRDNDRDRDTANSRSNRDSTRGDREPAWMGDYVPETSGKTGGSRANDSGVDDLQAWKRSIKEKELAVATSEDNAAPLPNGDLAPQPPPNDLDDLQLFKLKVKQEQEKRDTTSESEGVAAVAPLDPPPGLSATVDTSMTTQPSEHSQVISLSDVFPSHPNPIPKYQSLAAHQSPMSVAGIDGDVMAAHPHSSLGQSLQSQPTRDLSNKSLSQPLNGRLTPTSSASHVPSSSSSQYAGERTGSPSGPSSPASQAPKGSRFAKFWDKNKPGSDMGGSARDTTSASTPSPTGVNLSGGLGGTPTWAAGANIHPQDPRVGRSQSRSSSVASGGIPPNRLDGLLQQMNINDVPQQTVYPPANEHEAERMQNLLSMLTGSSAPPLMNGADFPYNNRQAVTHHDQLLQQQQQPSLLPQRLPLQHQQSYSYPSPSNIQAGTHQPSASEFDRSFVPDNMVPGLRPSRSRDQSLHQLPINVQNSQNHGPTSYLDEAREREREREHFLQQQQRLQHQGSWEQLQLQNQGGRPASVGAGPNSFNPNPVSHIQPLSQGPPRLSSGAMQLNALRQSPNHLLQQQQLLRNARNGFDSFSSQQFSGLDRMNGGGGQNGMGMNLNGAPQQFGNGGLNISPTGPNGSSSRLYDSLPNQAFVASNGLSSNGAALAGYDFPPPRQQEAPNRMLASSAGGGGLRDLDGGLRLGQNGMYNGGAPSLQQQHLLQQLQPNPNGMQFGGGGNNMAAHQQQPQALSQLHGVGGSAGLRPVNPVASLPNDFMMAPNQSFSGNRSYNVGVGGNMGMSMPLPPQQQQHLQQLHHHHPQQQQNQPDLMALLMGRQPPYRGE